MTGAWLEIFKTGTHTSGNGVTKTYTDADLDSIVTRYNTQETHDAPLVLGHPATDAPAYGWAKELKAAGGKLLAYVDQVSDDVVNAVKMGAYKKISIALYPDGLLRHIGLLGATPPAVKGLTPVQFAEGMEFEEYTAEIPDEKETAIGRILAAIRDFLVTPSDSTSGVAHNFSENQQEEEKHMDELKAKIKVLEDALAAQSVQFAEVQGALKVLTDAASAQAQAAADKSKQSVLDTAKTLFAAFCEDLAKEGKILPAEKDGILEEYADLLAAEETLTFAEGVVKPSEKMKTRLGLRPVLVAKSATFADPNKAAVTKIDPAAIPVEFAELAAQIDASSLDIDKQIKEYAEANKVSYEEAAERYMKA
jgi:hypothetical protein